METWYDALCAIADHSPMAYWQMSNGAEFWWMPGRSQLGPDRFTSEPFSYAEIVSVTVFDTVPIKPGGWACDFEALRARLAGVTGLWMEELRDVRLAPATPPNRALRLTVGA